MPFINVKVAGPRLEKSQTVALQKGITSLMAEVLRKQGPLTAVLVEQVAATGWSIGGEPVTRAAQVDAYVSAGTNTPEEKSRYIAAVFALLRTVLGREVPEVSYVLVPRRPHEQLGVWRADSGVSGAETRVSLSRGEQAALATRPGYFLGVFAFVRHHRRQGAGVQPGHGSNFKHPRLEIQQLGRRHGVLERRTIHDVSSRSCSLVSAKGPWRTRIFGRRSGVRSESHVSSGETPVPVGRPRPCDGETRRAHP